MGIRTALQTAPQWHTLSGRLRPRGGDFGRVMREDGLRAAIAWRDGPFRDEGFEP
jgi:enoyl-CoA hydratase